MADIELVHSRKIWVIEKCWKLHTGSLSVDHSNFCGGVQIIASVSAGDIARNDTSQLSASIESAEENNTNLKAKVRENIGILIPHYAPETFKLWSWGSAICLTLRFYMKSNFGDFTWPKSVIFSTFRDSEFWF